MLPAKFVGMQKYFRIIFCRIWNLISHVILLYDKFLQSSGLTFFIRRPYKFFGRMVLSSTESSFSILQTPQIWSWKHLKIFFFFWFQSFSSTDGPLDSLILYSWEMEDAISSFLFSSLLFGFILTMAVLSEPSTWSDTTFSVVWFCGTFCMLDTPFRLLALGTAVADIVWTVFKFSKEFGYSLTADLSKVARFNPIFVHMWSLGSRDENLSAKLLSIFLSGGIGIT